MLDRSGLGVNSQMRFPLEFLQQRKAINIGAKDTHIVVALQVAERLGRRSATPIWCKASAASCAVLRPLAKIATCWADCRRIAYDKTVRSGFQVSCRGRSQGVGSPAGGGIRPGQQHAPECRLEPLYEMMGKSQSSARSFRRGKMNLERYLKRIKYDGPTDPSIETLRRLHRAHMVRVPFENLDIHLRRPIVLDPEAFYTKIVEHRRGGFCYELNGLLALLLDGLGFDVTMLSAGVAHKEGGFGPEYDHMALLVGLDEPWLADVGFGDSFLDPVPLVESRTSEDSTGSYRVIIEGDYELLLHSTDGEQWRPLYRFTRKARDLAEFNPMAIYQQTSPLSSFTRRRICSRATQGGRVTLSEMKLIMIDGGNRQERLLPNDEEYRDALLRYFDIVP
jgi:N-hydroxyarylamine O-acetyltransferase